MTFARHSRVGSDAFQQGKKLIIVSFGNEYSEVANAFFRLDRNVESHQARPRLISARAVAAANNSSLDGSPLRF